MKLQTTHRLILGGEGTRWCKHLRSTGLIRSVWDEYRMQAPAPSWINVSHQVKTTHLKGRGRVTTWGRKKGGRGDWCRDLLEHLTLWMSASSSPDSPSHVMHSGGWDRSPPPCHGSPCPPVTSAAPRPSPAAA